MDNDIHYSGNLHLSFPTNKPYLLLKPTQTLLNALKNFKEEEINYLCDSITSRVWQHFHKEKVLAQMADNEQRYHFKYSEEDRNNIINRLFGRILAYQHGGFGFGLVSKDRLCNIRLHAAHDG